ncbi:MAG: DegV family protein, partial [Thermocrispum sp.]
MPVAVVTDSTAYLPEGFAKRHDITVVPLNVLIDGECGLDGVEVGPVELIDSLTARRKVTTSMPNQEELAAAYHEALDAGADAVVSVHLSRELSGTWSAAVMAAADVCDERG